MGCANSQPLPHTKSGKAPVINQLNNSNLQNKNQKPLTSSNNNGLGHKNQSKISGQQLPVKQSFKKPTQLGYNNQVKASEIPTSKIFESNNSNKLSNNNVSSMMGNQQKITSELIRQKKANLQEQQVIRELQSLRFKKIQEAQQNNKQKLNNTISVEQSLKTPQLQINKFVGQTKELQKKTQIKQKKQQVYEKVQPNLKQQNLQKAKQLAENLKRQQQTKIYQKSIIPLSQIKQVPYNKQQSIGASNSANKKQSPQQSIKLRLMGPQHVHSIKPIHDKSNEKKVQDYIRPEDIKVIPEDNNYKYVSGLHQISTEDLTVSKQQIFDLECNFNPQSLIIDMNKVGW